MVARTLLFKWALLAPVGTTLCFIVQHQMLKDQFNPISVDPRVDNRIVAYVPLVKAIEDARFDSKPNVDLAKSIAAKWRAKSAQHKLMPLLPSYYNDEFEDGPRSQVTAAATSLVDELARGAILAGRAHKYSEGLSMVEDAVNVLEDLKYSDVSTLRLTLNKQRRLVSTLRWINAESGEAYTDRVSDIQTKFGVVPEKLEVLAKHFHSQYVQYSQRYLGVDKSLVSEKSVNNFLGAILRVAENTATAGDKALLGGRESFVGMPDFLVKMHLSVSDSQHQLIHDLKLDPIAYGPGLYPNMAPKRENTATGPELSKKQKEIWALRMRHEHMLSDGRRRDRQSIFGETKNFDSTAAQPFLNP